MSSSMANAWVDSYLDALLSAGLSTEHISRPATEEKVKEANLDADAAIAAKYYVNQILNTDEEGIREAWKKVSHNSIERSAGERDARLQYLSWRVWGMKRKQQLVLQQHAADAAGEELLASTPSEDQSGPIEPEDLVKLTAGLRPLTVKPGAPAAVAVDNVSEDSDERDAILTPPETPGSPLHSRDELQVTADRCPKLYCVLISMHGLVRGEHMELGKDPDTGGQVKYVVELAKALSRHPAVHRVDLLTRLIRDPKVDASYGLLEEPLTEIDGQLGGAYIARIPCGPVNMYLRKEALWPYIREFADNALTYVCSTMAKLQAAGEACELYDIHGHYADAGEAAALMSYTLGVDMVLTGHSLGRNKLEHLLKSGTMSRQEIEAGYAISRRIEGEERALDAALLVFTSTQQEVKDQWGLYDGYDAEMEGVVRRRLRRGRHFPLMRVIPPGLDFSNLKCAAPPDPWDTFTAGAAALRRAGSSSGFLPATVSGGRGPRRSSASASSTALAALQAPDDVEGGAAGAGAASDSAGSAGLAVQVGAGPAGGSPKESPRTPATPSTATTVDAFARPTVHEDPPIWRSIFKFLRNPRKPVILAMSRPDAKKNITTLVKAYGNNMVLRDIANLVLVMGNRDVIDGMAAGSAKVLDQVLKLIDAYDLYGSVAYPKRHTQNDISDIYLLPAETRGVFVNIALQEPFGLTLIEAAAHGVPIVATTNGGPVDIIHTLKNGELVDPTNEQAVANALLKLLTSNATWDEYSTNGVTNINAYSWSSHCMKCLDAVEAGKISMAKRSMAAQLRSNYSASLDDFTFTSSFSALRNASDSSLGNDDGRCASGGLRKVLLSPRASAAAIGHSFTTDDINLPTSSSGELLTGSSSRGDFSSSDKIPLSPRARSGDRNLASTSVPLAGAYGSSGSADFAAFPSHALTASANSAHMDMIRDKYVVFVLDSSDTVSRLSKLLARKGKALKGLAAAGHSVGVGVATVYSLTETATLLKSAGLGLSDLDFAITSSGGEIWYCGSNAVAGDSNGNSNDCILDDQYDAILDQKWDLISVKRVLHQCISERHFLAPTGSSSSHQRPRPKIRMDTTSGSHHLMVTLKSPTAQAPAGNDVQNVPDTGAGSNLALTTADQLALIGRIKRRFRHSGLRTQVVAQMDNGNINLHITPLRASRSLALRHLTYKHKVDMTSLVLVCCATDIASTAGGPGLAKFSCSDLEDVVAGVQGVLVVPPRTDNDTAAAAAAADGFHLDLSLYTHNGRLQLLPLN